MRKALILADQLAEEHVAKIQQAGAGWLECQNLKQDVISLATPDLDIIIGWADAEILRESSAKVYLCGSAGIDAYQGKGLHQKNDFCMTSAAGTMSVPIAEHCLGLMFALVRKIPLILSQQKQKHFSRVSDGCEVAGSTACIVGMGNSGEALAQRCQALGMKVVGVRRNIDQPCPYVDKLLPVERLSEGLAVADHVFCLLPGGEATRDFFNAEVFNHFKPGAFYYSASRGSVTCEEALLEAMETGRVAAAGLDVFKTEPLQSESPFWDLPNAIVSPHSAGHSCLMNDRLTALFVDNLNRLKEGRPLYNEIPLSLLA